MAAEKVVLSEKSHPLILTEQEVSSKLNSSTVRKAVHRAHIALATGQAENCVRQRVRTPGFSLHSLSAASRELDLAATKVYGATKNSLASTLLLYSSTSGKLIGNFEANELGRKRTAAVAVLAFCELLKAPKSCIALIGTGFQAWGILEALKGALSMPFTVNVFGRDSTRREDFCRRARDSLGLSVHACDTPEIATAEADSLFLSTTSSTPVVSDDALGSLRFICALGANALSRRELEPRSVTRACQVVVDSREAAKVEGGTLLSPIENGRLSWQEVSELGELFAKQRPLSSPTPGKYLLFCSHGLAVQDLYAAATLLPAQFTPATGGTA